MQDFESILSKCRKLAALCDPSNGASAGEIANAKAALARLMSEHDIEAADFDPAHRVPYSLLCISRRRNAKPVREKALTQLAVQCLALITGAKIRATYRLVDYFTPQKGLMPDKRWRVYEVTAEVTVAEASEWRECFQHYVESYLETLADLRAVARAANRAVKLSVSGFAAKHRIYPESDGTEQAGKPVSPEKIAAIIAAMQASKGDAWERKAGHIEGGLLLK